jgi:Fe-S oxidoreductase
MDRDRIREREARCIAEQPPACATSCPVHVDARAMIERVRRGDFAGALAVFQRSVPLPRIIAAVCDHPCEGACRRAEAGDAIAIGALERACVEYGQSPRPRRAARLPARAGRVAVVGSGLSGLAAACDLAGKGVRVVLFEAGPRLGGRLHRFPDRVLPAGALAADLQILVELGVEVRAERQVVSLVSLAGEFDAVYAGTGPESEAGQAALLDGLARGEGGGLAIEPITFATSHERVFAGGGLRQGPLYSPIRSFHDGRCAAASIDRLLQRASLTAGRELEGPYPSRLYTRTAGVAPLARVAAADAGYSRAEAMEEAARCFPCACRECVDACAYLAHHGSVPRRYIRQIYNNDCIVMGSRKANRLANTCALCRLCEVVCPEGLGMAETCREARQSMVARGKMPPSTHEFALRDMAFSQGPDFALVENAPGTTGSRAVFFPGCQLSASSPEHVERVYALLRRELGAVGLHLGCCGAPADWAGRSDRFASTLEETAAAWTRLGATTVITACPSCTRVFRANLPGFAVESLWTVLARTDTGGLAPPRRLAIHDPCAARHDRAAQDAVRALLERHGVEVVEPDYTRERTTCCSYGGLMSFADRQVADELVRRRIGERDDDYVTYCAMCRDNFAARGKRSLHVLDLLWADGAADPAARRAPGYSQRRAARRALKAHLLEEVWGAPASGNTELESAMELYISEAVAAQLEERLILREDVEGTIAHAEKTGEKLLDRATGHLVACHRPALVTYWVEYTPAGAGFAVHAAWSHRMEICREPGP